VVPIDQQPLVLFTVAAVGGIFIGLGVRLAVER
jgi:hypothetical protein